MARQVFEENGVSFEVVDEDEPDDLLKQEQEEPSEEKPEPKAEVKETPRESKATAPRTARRAEPSVKVEVAKPEPEKEEPEEDDEVDEAILDEWEKELDAYVDQLLQERTEPVVKEAVGKVQSTYDKQLAKREKEMETLKGQLATVQEQILNNKLEGLSDEERKAYLDRAALEKRKTELDEYADELDSLAKAELVHALAQDYGEFGVTAEELEAIEDPDEMERFCERAELKFYRTNGGPAKKAEDVRQEKPVNEVPKPKPSKAVPPGATARTDIGGSNPLLTPSKPERGEGSSMEAAAQTLKALPWETVRIG